MALNLTPAALVNASSGLLFVALGAFALAVGRRDARARALAAFATSFGVTFVAINLWTRDETYPNGPILLSAAASFATVAFGALVVRDLARPLVGSARWSLRALFAIILTGFFAACVVAWRGGDDALRTTLVQGVSTQQNFALFIVPSVAMVCILVAVAGTAALVHGSQPSERAARAVSWLALGFGSFALFFVLMFGHLGLVNGNLEHFIPLALSNLVVPLAWLAATRGTGSRRARNVLLTMIAAGLLGLVGGRLLASDATPGDYGLPGIARTLGVFALGVAIFRHHLLEVPLPHVTMHGGTLAAAALAVLFIIAQIAQNFLSTQYGLLIGGLVAGALLLAARPIERALEQRAPAATPQAGVVSARERSYRVALSAFLRDGGITREEERELVLLAEHLGIPASRAYELRDEVEGERRT